MCDLQKKGDIALRYCISGRTLRYYEEIGILKSCRFEDSKYRLYDEPATQRLEQILLLRKLQLPIKDIKKIFLSKDISVAVNSVLEKLRQVENDMTELTKLKSIIQNVLTILKGYDSNSIEGLRFLQEKSNIFMQVDTISNPPKLNEEGIELNTEILTNEYAMDVRLIHLKPMKVAWYRAESASPEMDAWKVLMNWVEEKRLEDTATTRFFGFNNPCPTQDNPVYGYEVWVTIPENFEGSGEIGVKQFEGGDYAVISSYLHDITERWHRICKWTEASDYKIAQHQCLEETISPVKAPSEKMQFDLYCPIRNK